MTVATCCCGLLICILSVGSEYFGVVPCYYVAHVGRTAVAELEGVSINYVVQLVSSRLVLLEMLVDKS